MEKNYFESRRSSDWTKSLLGVPALREESILKHLFCHSARYGDKQMQHKPRGSAMKDSKVIKGVKLLNDGHVQKVSVSNNEDHSTIIKSMVLASMKQVCYSVYIKVGTTGEVTAAYCECVAGKGQACNHVAALLFYVEKIQKEELEYIPDDMTTTDIKCRWKGAALKKTPPAALDNIAIVRHEAESSSKQVKSTLQSLNFDPRPPDHRKINEEAFKAFYEGMKSSNPLLGFSKYAMPLPPLPDPDIRNSARKENSSLEQPASLHQIRMVCSSMKAALQLTTEQIEDLEQRTREQSMSESWHESCKYRLTASNFHKAVHMRSTTCPSGFLKLQLYSDHRYKTKPMKLGLEREYGAAQRYKIQKQLQGEHLTLAKSGLRVAADKGFLGASADRIATGADGVKILVELKNPDNTWEFENAGDIPSKQKCLIKTISEDGSEFIHLNRKHAFFTQIQGQLYVYGFDKCDFVLCTKHTIFIERIVRDDAFIKKMVQKLEAFYDNILLPEIVYPRVKFGLSPLDLSKLS